MMRELPEFMKNNMEGALHGDRYILLMYGFEGLWVLRDAGMG